MKNLENIKAEGRLSVVVTGSDGKVKEELNFDNLVVSTGLAFIVSRMKDTTAGAMTHMALGTGTTPALAGNTTLQSEMGSARATLASTNVTGNAITYTATFGAGVGTGAVTEAGIFNANASGTMLCRTVFPVVNKQVDDSMVITWTVTVN